MAQQVEVPGVGTLEFPDGMSQGDIASAIQKNFPQIHEKVSKLGQYGTGIADAAYGTAQSMMHGMEKMPLVGPLAIANVQKQIVNALGVKTPEAKEIDKKIADREVQYQASRRASMPNDAQGKPQEPGFDWPRMLGNVTAILPTGLRSAAQGATGLTTKVLGGIFDSALPSMMSPATQGKDYNEEKAKQVALNATFGAAVPAVAQVVPLVKSMIDPFSKSGQRKIVGNALNKVTGNYSDDAIYNLKNAGEIVPGSLPTAGQAAGNPGIAALERTATATDPVAMNEMARRLAAQNEARVAALRGLAPDRGAAVNARQQAAEQLYASADPKPVTLTPELASLFQRPSMKAALTDAQRLAEEKGISLDPTALTGRDAHFIKRALDDVTNAPPQQGFGQNQIGAVRDTKAAYLQELENQIPEYGQARQSFAEMSRPVNQADIAEEIAKKSVNFRGDITPAAYARALRDETAQSVTGQSNATLSKLMEPNQLEMLNNIRTDLGRADFANTAGKGVGSDTVQKLAYSNIMDKSGLPSWVSSLPGAGLVGRVADFGYKRSNEEMRQMLAQALMDPSTTAALMEGSVPSSTSRLISEALKSLPAAGAAMSPALLQGLQQ